MAWTGSAAMWTLAGGVLNGRPAADSVPGDREAAPAGTTPVVVDNFSFTPATVSVPVGTTVTWTNHDDIPHNVVSTERTFKSPVLDTNEAFSHTFDAAGTFKYYCSLHPRMTGQVVVR
jgi:amicyanin